MQILVDADACPVKEIIVKVAKLYHIPVTMLIDTAHELNDGYSTVLTVSQERDAVDFALMKLLKQEDIVVTQDFGLAALVLGKGARALNQNGLIFTDKNIEKLLFERFLGQKVRRSGGKTNNPKKRKRDSDIRFESELTRMIQNNSPKLIYVAAAIIFQNDKVLICQRAEDGSCAGLWEFPGGKQETGETLEECLIRECREELGITIQVKSVFAETNWRTDDQEMVFTFFEAVIACGTPEKKVHQDICWVTLKDLSRFGFCPADLEIVERIIPV